MVKPLKSVIYNKEMFQYHRIYVKLPTLMSCYIEANLFISLFLENVIIK